MNDTIENTDTNHRTVMLGGERTALEMLNDLIFDTETNNASENNINVQTDNTSNNMGSYITTESVETTTQDDEKNKGPYVVNDVDIAKLKRQIDICDDRAADLLTKHNGDQVSAMLEFYDSQQDPNYSQNNKLDESYELNNNPTGELTCVELEDILEVNTNMNNYQFAMLNHNSDSFRPHKKHCNFANLIRKSVVVNMASDMLTNKDKILAKCELVPVEFNRVLALDNDPVNKLMCLYLNGQASDVFKKWNMQKCGLIFWKSQVVTTKYISEHKCFNILNRHATRLCRLVGYLDDNNAIVGNCCIVNNSWHHA